MKTPIDTTRSQRLARAYTESATLYAALDLGLFSHVAAGRDTVAKLAVAMDVPPLNAERLVTAVQTLGLLRQVDGGLVNAPDAALWGLSEVLTRSAGKAHTIAQCRGYFAAAGFADISDTEFVAGVLHRVSGIKAE